MFEYFKLAWRNLWRNRRRTIITVTSVLFAVFFSLVMRAFQLGSYENMVINTVHSHSGYFQIHAKGYQDNPGMNNAMQLSDNDLSAIKNIPGLTIARRAESFVLVSYNSRTRGALLTGIVPENEDQLTGLKKRLIQGNFLTANDNGVLVSSKLADLLGIALGDSLVVLGQGFQGVSAAGIFPVTGIIKFPSPELDKQMIFISLPAAQELFSLENRLTSAAINLDDNKLMPEALAQCKAIMDTSKYEVLTWEEMMPEIVQQIEGDNASGLIMLGILYMIVAFGIFGTVLMMTAERRRESGVLIALGMKKRLLLFIQIVEMQIIGIIGIAGGMLFATPLIYYYLYHPIRMTGDMAKAMLEFGFEPIMPVYLGWDYYLSQALVIFSIVIIATLIPAFSIFKLTVIKAIRK
ncbi:MAG: ABC transporter permease [Bacteroidetes bacterium HGW-Bacteroidetes-21]|nr:MAG: ABC transporter permease [Bacteroidetes bacterium HGW-Bacteroidetes-21]